MMKGVKIIKFTILLDEDEVDTLYNMTPLHEGSVEGAVTNGVINQIVNQMDKKEKGYIE